MTQRPAVAEGGGRSQNMYYVYIGCGVWTERLDMMESPENDSRSCNCSAIFSQTLTISASLAAVICGGPSLACSYLLGPFPLVMAGFWVSHGGVTDE